MKVKCHVLAWVANVDVGCDLERCGAKSGDIAVQNEWTEIEEREKFGVGYQSIVT